MRCTRHHKKQFSLWVWGLLILTLLMIMLGGATRLTKSGLSIVEWKPVAGIVPPLSQQDWENEFQNYQKFPEYKKTNQHMQLDEFKFIFFMEYAHRLLGRLIGLFFGIPLLIFWIQGALSPRLKWRGVCMFLVFAAQGFMGWYMVKSGLIDVPHVSHFRLAAHFALALVFLAFITQCLRDTHDKNDMHPPTMLWVSFGMLCSTLLYGVFVAGLHGGQIYNTFPKMGLNWLPQEAFFETPMWPNCINNPVLVQFIHRVCALLTVSLFWITAYFHRTIPVINLALLITLQMLLGIATLLYQVPVSMGTLHQGLGSIIFVATIYQIMQPTENRCWS